MRISAKKAVSLITAALPFAVFLFLILITSASAETKTYVPLVGIPGVTDKTTPSLADYINSIYLFTISVGGLFGVVKIGYAGVKYSMSDVITDKSAAKESIRGVLLGLAILLIPFIVLKTINSDLTNLDVLQNAKDLKVDLKSSGTSGGTLKDSDRAGVDCFPKYDQQRKSCSVDCAATCAQTGGTFVPNATPVPPPCPAGRCIPK